MSRWFARLVREGIETVDHRLVPLLATRWEDLPVPVLVAAGKPYHCASEQVGLISDLWRADGWVCGAIEIDVPRRKWFGRLSAREEAVREAAFLLGTGRAFVSVQMMEHGRDFRDEEHADLLVLRSPRVMGAMILNGAESPWPNMTPVRMD